MQRRETKAKQLISKSNQQQQLKGFEDFTADFAVSVAGNWDDSESRSGGLPCRVVDSGHLVACCRTSLASRAAAWAS